MEFVEAVTKQDEVKDREAGHFLRKLVGFLEKDEHGRVIIEELIPVFKMKECHAEPGAEEKKVRVGLVGVSSVGHLDVRGGDGTHPGSPEPPGPRSQSKQESRHQQTPNYCGHLHLSPPPE